MAMCAVGPLASFGLFQSDGGKKESERERERDATRQEEIEEMWKLEEVKRECEINGISGYLLKCNKCIFTHNLWPIFFCLYL